MSDIALSLDDFKGGGVKYYHYKDMGNIYICTINIDKDIKVGDTIVFPYVGTFLVYLNNPDEACNFSLDRVNTLAHAVTPSGDKPGRMYSAFNILGTKVPDSGYTILDKDDLFAFGLNQFGALVALTSDGKYIEDEIGMVAYEGPSRNYWESVISGSINSQITQSSLIIFGFYVPSLDQYIMFKSSNAKQAGLAYMLTTSISQAVEPKSGAMGLTAVESSLLVPFDKVNFGNADITVENAPEWIRKVFDNQNTTPVEPEEKPEKKGEPAQNAPDMSSHYGGGHGDFDYSSDEIDDALPPDIRYNELGVAGVWTPTKSQLKDVFKKIWSNDFFKPIQDLFANNTPLDAIISLRHYPFNVPSSGTATMALGTVSTGVEVNIASKQFVTLMYNGKVKKFADDFNDYEPYLDISIHLPFVGFVKLDTNTVMGKDIRVKYLIDITTGSTLVVVSSPDDKGKMRPLYEYETQLGYDIPVTAMDSRNQSRNAASFAVSTMMAMASMGSNVPASQMALQATGMTVAGSTIGGTQLQKSGSIGGPAGCMDTYDVYIVYKCPSLGYPYKDHPGIHGYKAASYSKLSTLKGTGYTEAEFVNCAISGATADEMKEIESIVKSGVIL